ncbi:MAG: hypothetical protein JNM17_19210 [Archangium sp.]|nr:hypothetical protein [Archangium sp.]
MKSSLLAIALVFTACGGTERSRVSYPVTVSGGGAMVTTDSGWTVTLTRATAHLDAVRFFEGKVVLAKNVKPQWWRSLLVSTAYAHPGHYVPGEALGEFVGPLDADLLTTTPLAWGTADGLTGEQGSLQLTFATAGLEVAGTATKDTLSVPFTASFTPAYAIEGVRSEHVVGKNELGVDVRIDLTHIFSRVDFAQVGSSASPLDPMSPAFNGFGRGVIDSSAYVVTWKEN